LAKLAGEPTILMPTGSGLRQLIDQVAQAEGVTLNHGIVTNQFPSLCEFVSKDLGFSIIPASAMPPSFAGMVVVRKFSPR
jgi:DNA-binding transcriptional LysR family regulator